MCVCVCVCVCMCEREKERQCMCICVFVCAIGTGSLDPLSGMVGIAMLSLNNNQVTGIYNFSIYVCSISIFTMCST